MMKKVLKNAAAAALVAGMMVGASGAFAAVVQIPVFSGKDPFPRPLKESPSLAKCDQGGSANVVCSAWEDGASAGDYTKAFTVTFIDSLTATWTFDPSKVTGIALSAVLFPKYIAVKGSNSYNVWDVTGLLTGTVSTEGIENGGDNQPAISHISFYDTGTPPAPVPLPASGLLLVSGLAALAWKRRKA